MGLAYEIVINSDPCISYCMEENTMAMQTLVMAHAAFGHNHFFKSNHLFRQWTDAAGILDYLEYARHFITQCEERHGVSEVERLLDAAHALMPHGVFRYRRPRQPSLREEQERRKEGARPTRNAPSTICGAPCPVHCPLGQGGRRNARAQARTCTCRKKTFSISWSITAPPCGPGSVKCCASSATSPVFLSAETDQADE